MTAARVGRMSFSVIRRKYVHIRRKALRFFALHTALCGLTSFTFTVRRMN